LKRPGIGQELSSGADSTNIQAGGDVHMNGISIENARQIAEDVYRKNALELKGVAEDVAGARAEKLVTDFLEKVSSQFPSSTENLADPDIQSVLFEAQRDFARSGEEDLAKALVDLLGNRLVETERSLRTFALNEALASAPKLTENQRRALGFLFYFRHTGPDTITSVDHFYDTVLRPNIFALDGPLPVRNVDFLHMEYVGVGTVQLTETNLGAAIRSGAEGIFTNGFVPDDVGPMFRENSSFVDYLIPCLRQPAKMQVSILRRSEIDDQLVRDNNTEFSAELLRLSRLGELTDDEVVSEALLKVPQLSRLELAWTSTSMKSMVLTSVGIALGHTYWRRFGEDDTPLSLWL
jgi:hypothetical protein